ncbi:hypothetical protein, partial [Vibrio sp. YT-18]|uniref:hypothetical protein n=1 Tax=Vibrio sp. YT-18 TaxID=3074709 RepID=UPI0029652A31
TVSRKRTHKKLRYADLGAEAEQRGSINQSINQSINFIYKAQYHKSQFASQGFTAYDIPLSLGPSQQIRKNSKKTL